MTSLRPSQSLYVCVEFPTVSRVKWRWSLQPAAAALTWRAVLFAGWPAAVQPEEVSRSCQPTKVNRSVPTEWWQEAWATSRRAEGMSQTHTLIAWSEYKCMLGQEEKEVLALHFLCELSHRIRFRNIMPMFSMDHEVQSPDSSSNCCFTPHFW